MRPVCLFLLAVALVFGRDRTTLDAAGVVQMVLTSLALDDDDAALANSLSKVQLSDRLTDRTVAFLVQQGAGPHSSAILEKLRQQSASFDPPTQEPVSVEAPAKPEQDEFIRRLLHYASTYVQDLPNFLCDAVTQRYTNLFVPPPSSGTIMQPHYENRWRPGDKFTEVLRFARGRELEEVLPANRKAGKNGGHGYVLPIKAVTFMRSERQKNRNEIEFVNYRRFDAESVLVFSNK